MRISRLFAFAAPLTLLIPLAQAAEWPAGTKQQYMTNCVAAASQSLDAKKATQHCECGAQQLSAQFSTAELKELMGKTQPSPELRTKALNAILPCRAKS
ncbi:hypothetical protein [Pseudomonas sp.]|uniref:hypothetical protein n=1 Tax=Pseudomonas sp. TaxID=306 RepID=UPI002625F779|nr:hypothetical protein [Pseudomonas sp.]